MPETDLDALLVYLREHGDRYSSETLRDHLVSQGFDPERVENVLRLYAAERGERGTEIVDEATGVGNILTGLALAVLWICGLGLLVVGGCTGALNYFLSERAEQRRAILMFYGPFVLGGVALIVFAILIIFARKRRNG